MWMLCGLHSLKNSRIHINFYRNLAKELPCVNHDSYRRNQSDSICLEGIREVKTQRKLDFWLNSIQSIFDEWEWWLGVEKKKQHPLPIIRVGIQNRNKIWQWTLLEVSRVVQLFQQVKHVFAGNFRSQSFWRQMRTFDCLKIINQMERKNSSVLAFLNTNSTKER